LIQPSFVDEPFTVDCSDDDPQHGRRLEWAHQSRCNGPLIPERSDPSTLVCTTCGQEVRPGR
jgi:hypothetical protein